MKKLKKIVSTTIWLLAGIYISLIVLLKIPAVQTFIGNKTAAAISHKLGTEVSVGRVNIGLLPNRIIIDDIIIQDQQESPMLAATRLSAKIELLPLMKGRIAVTSAQLFGLKATLYKQTPDSPANFQFALDSLASRDTTSHTPLDLSINSLIIRHGAISFHERYKVPTPGTFNTSHISATDISAHIILNTMKDDSLNINVKKLAFNEASGLHVRNLSFKANANQQHANLETLSLELPQTKVQLDHVKASYNTQHPTPNTQSIQFSGNISPSVITPSDLTCFINSAKGIKTPVSINASFSGTASSISIKDLDIHTPDQSLKLKADATYKNWNSTPQWTADIKQFTASQHAAEQLYSIVRPNSQQSAPITRLGDIALSGKIAGSQDKLQADGHLHTSAGDATIAINKDGQELYADIETKDFNLKQALATNQLGTMTAHLSITQHQSPNTKHPTPNTLSLKGHIDRIEYNGYPYTAIDIDGTYQAQKLDGKISIDDPNAKLSLWGTANLQQPTPLKINQANITADVEYIKPAALKITDQWGDANFSFNLNADIKGNSLADAKGNLVVGQFTMATEEETLTIDNLHIAATGNNSGNKLTFESDFADIEIEGQYDYATIPQSLTGLIASKLPTLPGLPKKAPSGRNNLTINANISNSEPLNKLLDLPIVLHKPAKVTGKINDKQKQIQINAQLPHFSYNGNEYRDGTLEITTPHDTLHAHATITRHNTDRNTLSLTIDADAANNHLATALHFANNAADIMEGTINTDAQFFKKPNGDDAAQVDIHTSTFTVGNTIWEVEPATIVYSKNDLTMDHVAVRSGSQHLTVNGRASKSHTDTLTAELQDIDISYILDLLDFHSVEFAGAATGQARLTNLFEKPEAEAELTVGNFKFQEGRLGTLYAEARLNNQQQQIDITAIARETPSDANPDSKSGTVRVEGNISPARNEIQLAIIPDNARGEFLESFCGSFMQDTDIRITGDLLLYGPLSQINLKGNAVANGTAKITPLNTTYTLRNDTIRLIPNEIIFDSDTIYDAYEHIGIIRGALHHDNLTRLTYDLQVDAQNILAYDFRDFGDDTFCGTVYATGTCQIRGKSGEVNIDVNVTPDEGTEFRYNAATPDQISNGEFITWTASRSQEVQGVQGAQGVQDNSYSSENPIDKSNVSNSLNTLNSLNSTQDPPTTSDIRLNFLINATPSATLKLIMDNQTGDYIALNGNGVIRATYYNKGAFDMYGNYNVDHGTYRLTIQNVIRKEFQFQPGGTIVFGGDPYNAALNLQALYTVAGVPLSDLQLGNTFTSNNIRVNCLMNIIGTPYQPQVEFDLDMPTVSTDAKQMIFSLINSQEEMNQQVLYLLAVGRFYNQGTNNAATQDTPQQSQTSLAMQSLLSGTISQQLNNILASVVNNPNWNFGANISTGDQGFYNAEYEGLLSGRLLNNRLLINGEFGYRDNPNATTTFIGDFDLRYLLKPNGNLAIKVYNQTNDRYFTRNSLNTQGIGLIMKKDFSNLHDLFGIKPLARPAQTQDDDEKAAEEPAKEPEDRPKATENLPEEP